VHSRFLVARHRAVEVVRAGLVQSELSRGGLACRRDDPDAKRIHREIVFNCAGVLQADRVTFLRLGSCSLVGLNLNSEAVTVTSVGRSAATIG
jgi:hypothetical protein